MPHPLSIQQHQTYVEESDRAEASKAVQISSLGGLAIRVHGKDIAVQSWKSPKVYQLLSLIVAMGGKNIFAYQLCDAIWADAEGDKGMQNLEFMLRRLRQVLQADLGKTLRAMQVIQFHQGKVSLNEDYCSLDIWQWQDTCAQARTLRSQGDLAAAVQLEIQAAALLKGDFLAGDHGIEAVGGNRSNWHARFSAWLDATVTHWRNDELYEYHQMTVLFDIWLQLDPASERLCMQRMRVLLNKGYSVDARRIYYIWVQRIKDEYGLRPSEQAIALSNRISKTLNNVIK